MQQQVEYVQVYSINKNKILDGVKFLLRIYSEWNLVYVIYDVIFLTLIKSGFPYSAILDKAPYVTFKSKISDSP